MNPWTKAEATTLTRMWTTGSVMTDIAVVLGRSANSVSNKAQRMGLKRPAGYRYRRFKLWTDEEDARLMEMVKANVPWSEIAYQLGRSYAAVNRRGYLIDAPGRKSPLWTAEDDATLAVMWLSSARTRHIAEALGRSVEAVQMRAVKIGLKRPEGYHWRKAA
jgi:hypothetical protein